MNWERIFTLIEKAGGRHFIVDKNKEQVFVVLPLEEYEKHICECSCEDDIVDEEDLCVIPEDEKAMEDVKTADDFSETKAEEQFYIEPLE